MKQSSWLMSCVASPSPPRCKLPRDPRRDSRGERSPWLPLETRPDSPGEPGMHQGASRAAPGKSGLRARDEGERVLALEPHPLGNSEGPALSAWGAPPAEARSQVPQRPVSMLCWGTCDPVRGGRARRLRPPSRTRGLLRAQSPAAPREAQRRPRTRSSAPSGPARAMRSPSLVLGLRPAAMAPATPERPS